MLKKLLVGVAGLVLLLIGGLVVLNALNPAPPRDDHWARAGNAFQAAVSQRLGDAPSSIPPTADCSQVDGTRWRCFTTWAPVGHPDQAETREATVDFFEGGVADRIVVGKIERTPGAN